MPTSIRSSGIARRVPLGYTFHRLLIAQTQLLYIERHRRQVRNVIANDELRREAHVGVTWVFDLVVWPFPPEGTRYPGNQVMRRRVAFPSREDAVDVVERELADQLRRVSAAGGKFSEDAVKLVSKPPSGGVASGTAGASNTRPAMPRMDDTASRRSVTLISISAI